MIRAFGTHLSPSIRSTVALDGFQDYRVMLLVESLIGREETLKMLRDWGLMGYKTYLWDSISHIKFRALSNQTIKKYLNE